MFPFTNLLTIYVVVKSDKKNTFQRLISAVAVSVWREAAAGQIDGNLRGIDADWLGVPKRFDGVFWRFEHQWGNHEEGEGDFDLRNWDVIVNNRDQSWPTFWIQPTVGCGFKWFYPLVAQPSCRKYDNWSWIFLFKLIISHCHVCVPDSISNG